MRNDVDTPREAGQLEAGIYYQFTGVHPTYQSVDICWSNILWISMVAYEKVSPGQYHRWSESEATRSTGPRLSPRISSSCPTLWSTYKKLLKMTTRIVDLFMKIVIFHTYVNVYQRVPFLAFIPSQLLSSLWLNILHP